MIIEPVILLTPIVILGIVFFVRTLYLINNKGVYAMNFPILFGLVITAIYALIPIIVFFDPLPYQEFYNLRGTKFYLLDEDLPWLKYLFVLFTSLLAILFAELIPIKNNKYTEDKQRIEINDCEFHISLVRTLLLITLFLTFLLVFSYGGPFSYMSKSLIARHLGEDVDSSSFAFLKRIVHPFATISMLYSISIYSFIKESVNKKIIKIRRMFAASLLTFLFLAISSGGRQFLLFGLIQAVFCYWYFNKIKIRYILVSTLLLGAVLIYGKPIFGGVATYFTEGYEEAVYTFNALKTNPYITPQGSAAIFRFFVNYPQHLMFVIADFDSYRFLWMDAYNMLYSLWPRAIFDPGIRLQMPIEITSLNITNGMDEKAGALPGLLAYFGMIAGWWLIPFFVFTFTLTIKYFLNYLKNRNNPFHRSLYVLFLFFFVSYIWNGEPVLFVNYFFPVTLVYLIYFIKRSTNLIKFSISNQIC